MKFKKSKITILSIFTWITIYFINNNTREYLIGSGPGTIDNYINIGYGQKFPETTFQYHYYKESRLLTILWVSLTNNLNLSVYTFASISLTLITSLIILNLIWEKQPSFKGYSLGFALMLTLSPFLWGEYVGGSDNYNQIGNLIIALYIRYCFNKIAYIENHKSQKFKSSSKNISRKHSIVIGFGTFVVINEVPTGIFVILIPLLVVLGKNLKNLIHKKTNLRVFFVEISHISSGFFAALFFYALFFEASTRNAERSLSGLKFILTNLENPQIQLSYFLPLQDSLVWKSSVATTLILSFFLFSIRVLDKIKKFSLTKALDNFEYSYLAVVFYLLVAQLLEKNIVFGSTSLPGYFLAPILLCGVILVILRLLEVLKWIISKPLPVFLDKDFIGLLILGGMGFLLDLTWFQVATCVLISSVGLVTQELFRESRNISEDKNFMEGRYKVFGNKTFIIQSLISATILCCISFFPSTKIRPPQNLQCESFYYLKKQDALRVAERIDQNAGKRGTVYMGADRSVIDLEMDFRGCETFKSIKLADYLYAISAMGFIPVDQVAQSETGENTRSDWNYQQNRLAVIKIDSKPSGVCSVIWSLRQSKVITFLDIDGKRVFGNLTC
jgi:hypothetical protein